MANRDDPNAPGHSNDPVTAPTGTESTESRPRPSGDHDAPRHSNDPVTAPTGTESADSRPRQSEVNAPRQPEGTGPRTGSAETRPRSGSAEAQSRARAKESGRSAAKWFGIALAALVVILLVGGFLGGGAWVWGPADEEPLTEEVE